MSSDESSEGVDEIDNIFIYEGARLKYGDFKKLMAAFVVRAQLPDASLEHLLQIVNLVAMQDFVTHDVRSFLKQYNTVPAEKHYVCPLESCQVYLSPLRPQFFYCEVCEKEYNCQDLVRNRSFFSYLSIKHQLKLILEEGNFHDQVQIQRNDGNSNSVVNSRRYQSLVEQGIFKDNDLTLLFNTDGVQASVSSKLSLWPVQLTILEVPLQQRHKYVILPLVWLSKIKPKLNEILIPVIKELKNISEEGITTDRGKFKFHCLLCPVDSQARVMLSNLKQYNGAHSCVWCLSEGQMLPKGSGHARFFVKDLDAERRTTRSMLQHANIAYENDVAVFGVKGYSIMGQLQTFDLVWGYNPEYLHNICLGVTVRLLEILIGAPYANKSCSIRRFISTLDDRIMKITPTSEMTRLPEKLSMYKNMKASLLRNILCYYLLPILHDIASSRVKNALLLLVYSVRTYLKDTITEEEERKATACVKKFCEIAPDVFDIHMCTYNLHIFSHVPEICREWGALWDSSTFSFESHNGFLMKLSHGTKYQTEQIMRNHQLYVNHVINESSDNPLVMELLETLKSPTRRMKICKKIENAALSGKSKDIKVTNLEKIQMQRVIAKRIDSAKVEVYTKFSYNGLLVHTYDYKKLQLRMNCVVETIEGDFVAIKDLLVYKSGNCEGAVLRCFKYYVRGFDFARDDEIEISSADLFFTGRKSDVTHFLKLSSLSKKYACFEVDEHTILTRLSNKFERD